MRNHSLIDLRASRGVVIEDARTRLTHPNRRIDIRGIGNHDINYVSNVIVGRVTKITIGEVIIMMNQNTFYSKCSTTHSSRQVENLKKSDDDKRIKVGIK